jgi:transcription elongation factor Elf1
VTTKKVDLTEKQKADHLKKPHVCPFCGSPDIEGQSVEVDGSYANQRVSCVACGRRWYDNYSLTSVEAGDID